MDEEGMKALARRIADALAISSNFEEVAPNTDPGECDWVNLFDKETQTDVAIRIELM